MQAVDERVPGDVSAAAFWLVAGAIHPDAELTLRDVGVNPTRRAVIDILRAMGADIEERPAVGRDRPDADDGVGEPLADLVGPLVRRSAAIDLGPADVAAAIDEIPVLCLAAPRSPTARPRSAAPASCATRNRTGSPGSSAGLGALGARIEVDGDDLTIHGGRPPRAAPRPTASTTTAWR